MTLDLAMMFLDKFLKDPSTALDLNLALLQIRIFNKKKLYDKCLEFIETNANLFPIAIEKRRQVLEVLRQKEDRIGQINVLMEQVRENYIGCHEEFTSCFDLHELLITMVI
jgi:hypothetical protein